MTAKRRFPSIEPRLGGKPAEARFKLPQGFEKDGRREDGGFTLTLDNGLLSYTDDQGRIARRPLSSELTKALSAAEVAKHLQTLGKGISLVAILNDLHDLGHPSLNRQSEQISFETIFTEHVEELERAKADFEHAALHPGSVDLDEVFFRCSSLAIKSVSNLKNTNKNINHFRDSSHETKITLDKLVNKVALSPSIGGILQRFTTKTGRTPKPLLTLFQKHGEKIAAGSFTLAQLRIEDPVLAKAVKASADRQGIDVGDILPTGDLVKPGRKAKEPDVDPYTLDPKDPVEGLLRQKILAEQERLRRQAANKAQRRKIRKLSMDK